MKDILIYETFRKAYSTKDIKHTMNVGELIEFLQDYDPETPIYLSFDNGYTYEQVTEARFELQDEDEEEYY